MTPAEQEELAILERLAILEYADQDLDVWAQANGYVPAAHHKLINRALERLERGEITRLMIFMPPGSAKSTYGSTLFPPWYMGRNQDHNVLTGSHTMGLAARFGRKTRNIVRAEGATIGIAVAGDSAAADRWSIVGLDKDAPPSQGGEYMASGVDTGIAGFRADLAVIDDPIKSRQDAESETIRQNIWDWWVFDLRPRLKPGGKVLLIMTRWHEDDLAGRILLEEGERWEVLRLPMECDSKDDPMGRVMGARLWPEWFTDDMVREAKQDPYLWNSLYQQNPSSAKGTYWKSHWFMPVEPSMVPPLSTMKIYGGSDYATKEGAGDYTVHLIVGIDPSGRPWLLDLWRGQTTSDVWVDVFCDMVLDWRPMGWAEERGQIMNSVGPFLEKEQLRRKAYTAREIFTSVADKSIMGQSMRGYIAMHGLYYDRTAPWARDFINELLSFPTGKHDDQHDALAKVGMLMQMIQNGTAPKAPDSRKVSGYKPTATPAPFGVHSL